MKLSAKLLASAVIAALGGFLFGFDTVVISGAEQRIQSLWGLGDSLHGLAMSAALWGTVLGSLTGSIPTDRLGRKGVLLWIGVLYFISAVWSGLAPDVYSFIVARFIGGVGVGISTVAAPLYISEIAPSHLRGRLAGMFQFNIVFGILIAFISNAALDGIGENAWRWMLGVEALPAAAYTLLCFLIPESPRWLVVKRQDQEAARRVMMQILPACTETEIDTEIQAILASSQVNDAMQSRDAQSMSPEEAMDTSNPYASPDAGSRSMTSLKTPIMLAFLVAFFNQLSGINAVLYFAPRIFQMTGLGEQAALLQSVGIGVTNLVFTLVGLALIDRLGRKTLLILGSLGYIASLGLCSWAFSSEQFAIVPACIFAFIAAHAIGQGAVIWVFISEIFPNQYRAMGNSLGSGTHWVFAAGLTFAFPAAVGYFAPEVVFAFFCGMMVLQLVWVLTMVPETKGVPLEEIQRKLGYS